MTREQAVAFVDALDEYGKLKDTAKALVVRYGRIHEEVAEDMAEARERLIEAMHPIVTGVAR